MGPKDRTPAIAGAVLAASLALLVPPLTRAHAVGLLVGPPESSDGVRLEAQYAVIDVSPSGEVHVDVHLALSDEVAPPREAYLVVPFATSPEAVQVQAASGADFREELMDPLSHESFRLANDTRVVFVDAALVGGLLGGPAALASAAAITDHLAAMPRAAWVCSPSDPRDTVAVACVGWQMYESLDVGELAEVVGSPLLPEGVTRALQPYAGGPFALVRLETRTDSSAELGTPLWRGQSPGLRLSFRQPMQHEHEAPSYTYSLRIGQWQGRPLDMVSAFVTARDELAVSPELGPPPSSVSMADSHAWMTENHGRDRHIYHMSLLNWRPQEDLIVRNTGVGSLARQHEQRRLLLAQILFPLAGALAWLLTYYLLVWPSASARRMGWVRAIVKSWGAPYLVALGPMYLLTYGSAIDPDITPVNVGWDRFLTEVWGDPGSLVCLLLYGVATVLTAFVAWRIVVVLTAGDRGAIGLHALALLTSALAGVVYLSAIRILAPWLSLGFAVDR